jgi:hypothetical protein
MAQVTTGMREMLLHPIVIGAGQSPIARSLISCDRGQRGRNIGGFLSLPRGLVVEVTGTLVHRAWMLYMRWHMECRLLAAGPPSCANGPIGAQSGDS